jgi:glycosyltransferase involved in cell wall biosynthesis
MRAEADPGAPRVSVLFPTWNAERHLELAVESILAQTLGDLELVAVDDGSEDGTLSYLRTVAARDPRVRLLERPHRGLVPTLNDGLAACRARYVARMDDDDVARPERLARQVAHLDAHPECVALGTRVLMIDPEGLPVRFWPDVFDHEAIEAELLEARGGAIVHPAAMLRAEAVAAVGGYRVRPHAEDLDLFLRLAEAGQLENLPDTLLEYRLHEGSVGYRHAAAQRRSALAVANEARTRRGLEPLAESDNDATPEPHELSHQRWAWWALAAGNVATARRHALAGLRQAPLAPASWKLLACALRGH